MIVDKDTFSEHDKKMMSVNPVKFPDYEKKISHLQKSTGEKDAIITGTAKISGHKIMIAVMDNNFLMGSLGSVVGEKLVRLINLATKERLPVIIFSTSGGARMQEGIISLMQMAKVSTALKQHHNAGQLYIAFLTNPTTGGVTASFAMLGDYIFTEEDTLICFAGPRIIKQTIKQDLPEGFQRGEFLQDHGFIDKIISRKDQAVFLGKLLKIHESKE